MRSSDRPLIIDDLEPASERLSTLGKEVVGPASLTVREAITRSARAKGWTIADHSRFAEWVDDVADHRSMWLICDPLVKVEELAPYGTPARASRVLYGNEWRIEVVEKEAIQDLIRGRQVGLIDDVASTGATMECLARVVSEVGGVIAHLAVCCATSRARSVLAERVPGAKWNQLLDGNYRAIHLRDAVPYLPFSGRPCASHPPIPTSSGPVHVRLPSLTRQQGLWPVLLADYQVLAAMVRARSEVTARFSDALGREAIVADLPKLGSEVALPAFPRHEVAASTPLASIC